MSDDQVVDLKTSENLFSSQESDLEDLYKEYDIISIEVSSEYYKRLEVTYKFDIFVLFQRCAEIFVNHKIQWVEISLLVIAALIGFLAFIATIAICCFYSRYHILSKIYPKFTQNLTQVGNPDFLSLFSDTKVL